MCLPRPLWPAGQGILGALLSWARWTGLSLLSLRPASHPALNTSRVGEPTALRLVCALSFPPKALTVGTVYSASLGLDDSGSLLWDVGSLPSLMRPCVPSCICCSVNLLPTHHLDKTKYTPGTQ